MLSADDFHELLAAPDVLGRRLNEQQEECTFAPTGQPLMVVAGPGSGKTTVMVSRALRLLFVDGVPPESIVITTFTKKAAAEIRTRWLLWGRTLLPRARAHPTVARDPVAVAFLDRVDLNRCVTGTLDSLCEVMVSESRSPLDVPAVLVEAFAANQLMLRSGLKRLWYANQDDLNAYLSTFGFDGRPPRTLRDLVETARPIFERFAFDLVDRGSFARVRSHNGARRLLVEAYELYQTEMENRGQLDFARLEGKFLERLREGALDELIAPWRAILVDEYQDTNPLQEAIYFELCRRTGASLTVVGDDDQSLYRFRGATVELFANFRERARDALRARVRVRPLVLNYRSTPEIIDFYNSYIVYDPAFIAARVTPPKPRVERVRPTLGLPVLGMFRATKQDLARDVATFLRDVFRGDGAVIRTDHEPLRVAGAANGGDVGDAVFLCSSVAEWKEGAFGAPPEARLPHLLRQQLTGFGIGVFNPRGQALRDQPAVQTLLGVLLECLDPSTAAAPEGTLALQANLTNVGRDHLRLFRAAANRFIARRPPPTRPHTLGDFVHDWNRQRSRTAAAWPDEWPVLELVFTLLTWMPDFLNEPEQQVWLEAVTRTISQAALFSPYRAALLRDDPHRERSRTSAIRDVLRPIAENLIDVDEDLITHFPRNRLNVMTIHQSKGLEFPLVIIDVASDFQRNHRMNAFKRFPARPSSVAELEDDLARHCSVGAARQARSGLDRSFDDLVRQYYVAFSRPQTCLMLVGLDASLGGNSPVRSVATQWRRDETWPWRVQTGRKVPPVANNLPFLAI